MKNNIINILNPKIYHAVYVDNGYISIVNKKGFTKELKSYGLNIHGDDNSHFIKIPLCGDVYPDVKIYWKDEGPKKCWDIKDEKNLEFLEHCKISNPFLQIKNVPLKKVYNKNDLHYEAYVNKFTFYTAFEGFSRKLVVLSGCYSEFKEGENEVKTTDFKGNKKTIFIV